MLPLLRTELPSFRLRHRDLLPIVQGGMGVGVSGHRLAAALKGDVERGLFFRGSGTLPFGREIRPVQDLLELFLAPAPLQAPEPLSA